MGKHETKCTCSSSSKQPSFLTLKQLESLIPDRLQTLLVFFSSLPPTFVRKFYDSKASSSYTFIALSRSFEDDVMSRDRNFFLRVSINPIYIMIRQAWHFRLRPIDLILSQLPTLATYWAAIKRIKHAGNNTVVNIREAFSLCRHFNRCYHFESKGSNTLSKYLCLDRFKTVCRTYQQKLTNDYSLRSLESVNNSRSYISWNFHFEVSFLLYLLGKTFFFFPRKTQHQTNQGRNFLLFTISLLSHEWIKVGFLCKHRRLDIFFGEQVEIYCSTKLFLNGSLMATDESINRILTSRSLKVFIVRRSTPKPSTTHALRRRRKRVALMWRNDWRCFYRVSLTLKFNKINGWVKTDGLISETLIVEAQLENSASHNKLKRVSEREFNNKMSLL